MLDKPRDIPLLWWPEPDAYPGPGPIFPGRLAQHSQVRRASHETTLSLTTCITHFSQHVNLQSLLKMSLSPTTTIKPKPVPLQGHLSFIILIFGELNCYQGLQNPSILDPMSHTQQSVAIYWSGCSAVYPKSAGCTQSHILTYICFWVKKKERSVPSPQTRSQLKSIIHVISTWACNLRISSLKMWRKRQKMCVRQLQKWYHQVYFPI